MGQRASHRQGFCYRPIDEALKKRMINKSYKPNADFDLEQLVYAEILHYDFQCQIKTGELVINRRIADQVLAIFEELLAVKYPIEKMVLIDDYNADDDLSMADNNSSAFNYRTIAGTNQLSNHAMGLAIDINPLYNPYIQVREGRTNVFPKNGSIYTDRKLPNPYYIHKNDICYDLFIKHGFTWGGDWNPSKDYQHFEHK